jgi:hypothetical protein
LASVSNGRDPQALLFLVAEMSNAHASGQASTRRAVAPVRDKRRRKNVKRLGKNYSLE